MWGLGPCAAETWWVCLLLGLLMMTVMIAACFLLMRAVMGGRLCGHGRHEARGGEDVRRPG
jgi:hypothetical protein